jgi:ATPase subunit of ABC transporter with duplicated ATPase domains
MSGERVIFTMSGVTKAHERKPVFKDVSLSFYFGAKIGLLGLNGSGKSTLLRIIAGVDTEFDGEVARVAGHTLGYLPQEPDLGPGKTVQACVAEATAPMVEMEVAVVMEGQVVR